MKKIRVKIVKYDMNKTKKRNRKNMLVNGKTEADVITQLEMIHKGEKVETIHEIVWDEEQPEQIISKRGKKIGEVLTGEVKFFDPIKGFGFIIPDNKSGELFFHASDVSNEELREGDRVEFEVREAAKGPSAIRLKLI